MVNAQKWLYDKPKYNSKEKRKIIESLVIDSKNLENELDLSDFIKLKFLRCNNNSLTKLDLSNCPEIKEIYCQKNYLESLILPSNSNIAHLNINSNLLSNETIFKNLSSKLVYLDVRDNKFSQKNLSFLSEFTELEVLKLGRKRGSDASFTLETIWSHEDRHLNSFGGSLEPLKNMHKLDNLKKVELLLKSKCDEIKNSFELVEQSSSLLVLGEKDKKNLDEEEKKNIEKEIAEYTDCKKTVEEVIQLLQEVPPKSS